MLAEISTIIYSEIDPEAFPGMQTLQFFNHTTFREFFQDFFHRFLHELLEWFSRNSFKVFRDLRNLLKIITVTPLGILKENLGEYSKNFY